MNKEIILNKKEKVLRGLLLNVIIAISPTNKEVRNTLTKLYREFGGY